jgi:cell division protein ZapE
MTPTQRYVEYLASGRFQKDPDQALAIAQLDRIYHAIIKKQTQGWRRFIGFNRKKVPVKGLYLWGGVGIGKTWLMDILCDSLPEQTKMRRHFHSFMQQIHQELKLWQGQKNPLRRVAKRLAQQTLVLLFDEFFVTDITDAMILSGLLQTLFEEGVTLVATSNIVPDDLYKDGLQRERFLPAIELIKQNTKVFYLPSERDYRLRPLEQAGIYYSSNDEQTRQQMRARFEELAGSHWQEAEVLMIAGRPIPTVRLGSGVVWLNFQDLCQIPRSQVDYLELARSFNTILLSDVPQIASKQDNLILYLMYLVDILYDNQTKLIISAAVPIEQLYQQGRYLRQFQRTKSRLLEMQSVEYLQKVPYFYSAKK